MLDVRLGPSPAWLRDRLEQVGVRPISNVVDLTNYVMMEMGQPTHAFDLARIPGPAARALGARRGSSSRPSTAWSARSTRGPGVVAGTASAAGPRRDHGRRSSEVSDDDAVVALEAAYWEPLAIRRAARRLGMHTEASHRFERGADPEAPAAATARLAHLLEKIGAGTVRPGLIDGPGRAPPAAHA